jgi:hypothetical protein
MRTYGYGDSHYRLMADVVVAGGLPARLRGKRLEHALRQVENLCASCQKLDRDAPLDGSARFAISAGGRAPGTIELFGPIATGVHSSCVRRIVRAFRFPKASAGTTVTLVLHFTPKKLPPGR